MSEYSKFSQIRDDVRHLQYEVKDKIDTLEQQLASCQGYLAESVCNECKCENAVEVNRGMLARNKELKEVIDSMNKSMEIYSKSSCEKGLEIKKLKGLLVEACGIMNYVNKWRLPISNEFLDKPEIKQLLEDSK